jgi:hypothetical protein
VILAWPPYYAIVIPNWEFCLDNGNVPQGIVPVVPPRLHFGYGKTYRAPQVEFLTRTFTYTPRGDLLVALRSVAPNEQAMRFGKVELGVDLVAHLAAGDNWPVGMDPVGWHRHSHKRVVVTGWCLRPERKKACEDIGNIPDLC